MKNKEQFRMFYSSFWNDGQISEDLTPEDRYFYIYLLTNPATTQLGVYEITRRQMSSELGYTGEATDNLLKRFEDYHKLIRYNRDTKEIALLKWAKYNWRRGGTPVWDLVKKEIDETKDKSLILEVAQSAPDSWLKQKIREYMGAQNAQGVAQCADDEQLSENFESLGAQGIEEGCANAQDESYPNKEEIRINNNKKHMRNSAESLENEFQEFWETYGKKKDRKRAFDKFKLKRKKHSFEVIMNGVKAYLKECQIKRTEPQFIKHPSTFLTGDCFLDEYETEGVPVISGANPNDLDWTKI